MAKYYEGIWRSEEGFALDAVPRTLLAGALENDSLITFEEMYPSLVKLETAEEVQWAYAEAVTAVDFVTGFAGDAGLGRILRRMAEEPQLDPMQVMESSLEVGGGEFTMLWLRYLRGLKLDPIEGLEVQRHTVKGLLDSSSALDLKEIKSEVSRNHVRLGDMLKQRGRISAAVLEYRRALKRSPHSAVVLNRLGSSLARRGAAVEGEEVLRRAERLYPDYGPTYKNLAQLYRTQSNFPLADDYFVKAIRINPFDPSLHAGRRDVLTALGRTEEAAAEKAMLEMLLSGPARKKGAGASDTGDTDE
jgi:tetratricopeptide (TPR) repeat protein